MKTLVLILVYVLTFAGFYLFLSLFGLLWGSYKEAIESIGWFTAYFLFIGWWVALFPAMEYYTNNKTYFDRIFD